MWFPLHCNLWRADLWSSVTCSAGIFDGELTCKRKKAIYEQFVMDELTFERLGMLYDTNFLYVKMLINVHALSNTRIAKGQFSVTATKSI